MFFEQNCNCKQNFTNHLGFVSQIKLTYFTLPVFSKNFRGYLTLRHDFENLQNYFLPGELREKES